MDEKEIKRYRELNKKTELTEDEQTELDGLEAKKLADEESEKLSNALAKAFKAAGITSTQAAPEVKSEEVGKDAVDSLLAKDLNYRIGMQFTAMAATKAKDDRFETKYGKSPKAMLAHVSAMEKAAQPQTEGTAADGGILVPAITQARIIELIPTYGQARQFMQSFPMSGNVTKIPKELTNPTAYWVDEATAITDSKLTLEELTLTPKKLGAIVTASNEVLADASPSLGAYIVKKIAQAFGIAEDVQFFAGTGSPMTGIFNASNTFGGTVSAQGLVSSITYANLISLIAAVDQNYRTGAAFYANRSIMPYIFGMVDAQDRPIYMPAFGSVPATILGYPVHWIENAPTQATADATNDTPFILFGDLSNSYIGDVQGMTVKVFEEGTVDGTSMVETDMTGFRVIKRVAFNKGLTAKYSVIETTV